MTSGRAERMQGLLAIAQLTWLEARRRRIVLAALICGVVFLLVFAVAVYFIDQNDPRAALLLGIRR
jgi:hypothetical protein